MITVLTESTPFYNRRGYVANINRAFPLRLCKWLTRFSMQSPGGHIAVTRSLLRGLRTLGRGHKYNPSLEVSISSHCVVLSNSDALSQAIQLKRTGKVRRLLAGPNLFTLPTEMNGMLASAEVDMCLVPSEWVKTLYLSVMPSLRGRIAVWAAGVDAEYWNVPDKIVQQQSTVILLYVKSGMTEADILRLSELLSGNGCEIIRVNSGSYHPDQFRQVLAAVDLCVFVSTSESQGIALQEAWSCNRPTWVFNPGYWLDHEGRAHHASSAPYLTEECGHTFTNLIELEILCNRWNVGELQYAPRQWVVEHMTDKICASRLLHLVDNL